MKTLKSIIILIFIISLFSCKLSPFEKENQTSLQEDTTVTENSSLFESDIDSSSYTFETNDSKYLNEDGYTLWTVTDKNLSEDFEELSICLCKESGNTEAGFGLIFCEQEIDNIPFMLTVLINAKGLYTIGSVKNGVFTHIANGWTNSSYINKGLGVNNTITVSYNNSIQSFLLKINGYEITTFSVTENMVFKDCGSGFAVVIANNEFFPSVPVKVIFKK